MVDERLHVAQNEVHNVDGGTTEEYTGATVEGQLDVVEDDARLHLVDDPDLPGEGPFDESPSAIDLPLSSIKLTNMDLGTAWFITATMGILFIPIGLFKNYAAGLVWSMALVALLFSGLLGIGLEAFWSLVIATVLVVAVGMVVRWAS